MHPQGQSWLQRFNLLLILYVTGCQNHQKISQKNACNTSQKSEKEKATAWMEKVPWKTWISKEVLRHVQVNLELICQSLAWIVYRSCCFGKSKTSNKLLKLEAFHLLRTFSLCVSGRCICDLNICLTYIEKWFFFNVCLLLVFVYMQVILVTWPTNIVDILKLQNAGISKKRCHHAVLTPNSYLNCFFRAVEGAPPLGGVEGLQGGWEYVILLKSKTMANNWLFCFLCLIWRLSEARITMTNAKGRSTENV